MGKYEEFYYENDKNYPVSEYWELYDANHQAAIKKYHGHMFCPLCRLAPLTVANGMQLRYMKVVESDMDKHDEDCSYRRKKANKKDNEYFYSDLEKTDIINRLRSCMNRMLKKSIKKTKPSEIKPKDKKQTRKSFLDFETESGEIKYLPHRSLYSHKLEESLDIQTIYYGECLLYIYKYMPNGKDIKMYYLKILNKKTKKQICDISITTMVYDYLVKTLKDVKNIPTEKDKAKKYYVCFSGEMRKEKNMLNCKLYDSRLLVLEECEEDTK